ncbi:MAG TPA: hypothetical protein VLG50_00665 [Candidatus Saccharimonadales bacterium]|nr:hypothetical protein [Candidatus Saccharimonadales bacterium]
MAAQMALGATSRGLHSISFVTDSQDAGSKAKRYSFSDMFKAMRNNKKKVMAGLLVADILYERPSLSEINDQYLKSLQKGLETQHGKLVPCEKQELLDVFEELKTRMGVSPEYKLFVSSRDCSQGHVAFCLRQALIIYVCSGFFNLTLSEQVRALIHELQHTHQVDLNTAQFFICNEECHRDENSKNDEQDAEAVAVNMITCAQCLKSFAMSAEEQYILKYNLSAQLIEQNRAKIKEHLTDMQSQGYMLPSDYKPYLQKALKNDKPCKAHAQGGTSCDLRDYLPQIESK